MKAYRKYFTKSLEQNFPHEYDKIQKTLDRHYQYISIDTRFASMSANPIDRRLDFSAYFLALIKTLDERGESFEFIRARCLEIVTDYVKPKNKFQEFKKRLFPKLTNTWLGQSLIRAFQKRVSTNSNPDGFIANIITDKQETLGLGYGIDIIECGICKLFRKHQYQKYVSILCEVDKITSGLAGLELIRTGTLANGASKCDFRFQRKSKAAGTTGRFTYFE
jgi:hypothetical protein